MAEWLYEAGIGEARAALIEEGRIVKARIEVAGALRVGAVCLARLIERNGKGQGVAAIEGGGEVLVDGVPASLSVGRPMSVAVIRAVIPEPGRAKRAKARYLEGQATSSEGDDLLARITASGVPVRQCHAHQADVLEAAGWSEVLDEAMTGEIAFHGGALRLSPTPAMTLFDVDGSGGLDALAVTAATAVAQAIVRHDIGGSIGVDFPSITGRAARQAVADAIDAALPPPFERTALNGFGFLQIVRRRTRASLPELLRADAVASAARAALRQMERTPPGVAARHRLSPPVTAWLRARPAMLAELARRTGAPAIVED